MSPHSLPKDPGLSGIHCQGSAGHYSLCFGVMLQINCPGKALGSLGFQSSATHFCGGEQM